MQMFNKLHPVQMRILPDWSASTISSYNEKQTNTPCYIRASPHWVCMQAFFN